MKACAIKGVKQFEIKEIEEQLHREKSKRKN